MKVTLTGRITRDRRGRKGARLRVETEAGARWHRQYTIATHGLTDEQVADRLAAVGAHHARVEDRQDALKALRQDAVRVAGRDFTIADTRLIDIGEPGGDMELWIRVRDDTGVLLPKPWFPLAIVAREPSLPHNGALRALIRQRIQDALADEDDSVAMLGQLRRHETQEG